MAIPLKHSLLLTSELKEILLIPSTPSSFSFKEKKRRHVSLVGGIQLG
jgi:hypothetical protein